MSLSLKGCNFEHKEQSICLELFSDECAIVKEAICVLQNRPHLS